MMRMCTVLVLVTLFSLSSCNGKKSISRVACVGASNTRGYQIPDIDNNCVPGQIQRLAGEKWDVRNMGVGGTCVTKEGSISYWDTLGFRETKQFEPDLIILDFGWNDLKPQNDEYFTNNFIDEYAELIEEFKKLPSNPQFLMILPPLLEDPQGHIAESFCKLRPKLEAVAEKMGIPTFDLYNTPMRNTVSYYIMDKAHYSVEGCEFAAGLIYDELVRLGYTE